MASSRNPDPFCFTALIAFSIHMPWSGISLVWETNHGKIYQNYYRLPGVADDLLARC